MCLRVAAFLTATSLLAQTFDPAMPSNVPAVAGPIAEQAAVRYIDVSEGSGKDAAPGKRYRVHYTGWLRDGKKFDSSVDRKKPLEFVQGKLPMRLRPKN